MGNEVVDHTKKSFTYYILWLIRNVIVHGIGDIVDMWWICYQNFWIMGLEPMSKFGEAAVMVTVQSGRMMDILSEFLLKGFAINAVPFVWRFFELLIYKKGDDVRKELVDVLVSGIEIASYLALYMSRRTILQKLGVNTMIYTPIPLAILSVGVLFYSLVSKAKKVKKPGRRPGFRAQRFSPEDAAEKLRAFMTEDEDIRASETLKHFMNDLIRRVNSVDGDITDGKLRTLYQAALAGLRSDRTTVKRALNEDEVVEAVFEGEEEEKKDD